MAHHPTLNPVLFPVKFPVCQSHGLSLPWRTCISSALYCLRTINDVQKPVPETYDASRFEYGSWHISDARTLAPFPVRRTPWWWQESTSHWKWVWRVTLIFLTSLWELLWRGAPGELLTFWCSAVEHRDLSSSKGYPRRRRRWRHQEGLCSLYQKWSCSAKRSQSNFNDRWKKKGGNYLEKHS